MKISGNERLILRLLADHGSAYGLQLVDLSGGALKRGGIYVTLGSMEQKGLVTSEGQDDGRRVYALTGLAHRALVALEIMGAVEEGL